MMDLHQLEYVLAVAACKNFSRAAEMSNVSQSALSQQISKLEDELGVRLFERTTRTVSLTDAGKKFINHANRALSEIDHARRALQEYLSVEQGYLRIGAFPAIGYFGITSLIASFARRFPGISFELLEAQCEDLIKSLHASKVDVAFLSETRPDPQLNFYPLIIDELVLITSSSHPLASRQVVDLKEVSTENFIMTYDNAGLYSDSVDACYNAGFEPNIIFQCGRAETILGFVSENLGVTMLSSRVATRYQHDGIAIIRFTPNTLRKISLAVPLNEHLPPAVKVFVKFTELWLTQQNFNDTKKA